MGRRSAVAGTVAHGSPRTASPGDVSGSPGRCRRARCGRGPSRHRPRRRRATGPERKAKASAGRSSCASCGHDAGRRQASSGAHGRRRGGGRARDRRHRAARPASQAWPVRRSQATTQSWRARRSGGRPWSSSAIEGSRSRTCARGRTRGTRRARRGTAARRAGTSGSGPAGPTSRRATANGSGPAAGVSSTATGPRSGRSSARSGPVGRSRAARGPGRSRKASAASIGAHRRRSRSGSRRRRSGAVGEPGGFGPTGITRGMIRPGAAAGHGRAPASADARPLPSTDASTRPRYPASGSGTPGPLNAITDVAGVTVGHTTLISGDGPLVVGQGTGADRRDRRLPARRRPWREPVFAGCHRLNGNGELTGLEWVRESGLLTTPGRHHQHPQRRRRARCARRRVGRRRTDDATGRCRSSARRTTALLNDINGFHVTAPSTSTRRSRRRAAGRSRRARSVAGPA